MLIKLIVLISLHTKVYCGNVNVVKLSSVGSAKNVEIINKIIIYYRNYRDSFDQDTVVEFSLSAVNQSYLNLENLIVKLQNNDINFGIINEKLTDDQKHQYPKLIPIGFLSG